MFPEYDEQIKGEVADIKNVGEGRWGGAITAAKFLEQFVDKKPWTHMDIAGPAFATSPSPGATAAAAARCVRTLVEVARLFLLRTANLTAGVCPHFAMPCEQNGD